MPDQKEPAALDFPHIVSSLGQHIAEQSKENAKLEAENAEIRERNAEIRERNAEIRERNAEIRERNAKLRGRVHDLENDLAYSQAEARLVAEGYKRKTKVIQGLKEIGQGLLAQRNEALSELAAAKRRIAEAEQVETRLHRELADARSELKNERADFAAFETDITHRLVKLISSIAVSPGIVVVRRGLPIDSEVMRAASVVIAVDLDTGNAEIVKNRHGDTTGAALSEMGEEIAALSDDLAAAHRELSRERETVRALSGSAANLRHELTDMTRALWDLAIESQGQAITPCYASYLISKIVLLASDASQKGLG